MTGLVGDEGRVFVAASLHGTVEPRPEGWVNEFPDGPYVTWMVPVAHLRDIADPTIDWPWNALPPAPGEIEVGLLLSIEPLDRPLTDDEVAGFDPTPHLARIAWFYRHGWHDPISIDLGVPVLDYPGPEWPILYGNHRLYAAIVRQDLLIEAVLSGQVDHAVQLLGAQPTGDDDITEDEARGFAGPDDEDIALRPALGRTSGTRAP